MLCIVLKKHPPSPKGALGQAFLVSYLERKILGTLAASRSVRESAEREQDVRGQAVLLLPLKATIGAARLFIRLGRKLPSPPRYIFELKVPGTDLLLPLKATISADRLNCRVRYGIGCDPIARGTGYFALKML